MAVKAFILIQTEIEVARTTEVVAALRQLGPEVKIVDLVTGPYDIIAEVEEETPEELSALVENKIHFVPGVHRTATCFVI